MQMQVQLQAQPLVSGSTHATTTAGVPAVGRVQLPLSEVVSHWHHHPHHRTQFGETDDRECHIERTANEPVLTAIRRIDKFIGGFAPGSVSLLASQSEFMFNLVARLMVHSVKYSGRDVIYIDGGNSLDPYLLTTACRLFRVDADSVLQHIQVARAFTVFQLDTLITSSLERILARHKPRLVLVACFSELYLDRDVNWGEAKTLFEADFQKLEKLTEQYKTATLMTNFGIDKSIHRYELDRKLRKLLTPERRLSIKIPSQRKLQFVKGTDEFMDYFPLPPYQWTLDDFYPGGDLCG